jgi:hypothetical protein
MASVNLHRAASIYLTLLCGYKSLGTQHSSCWKHYYTHDYYTQHT